MSSYIIDDFNGLTDNEKYNQYTGINGVDTSYISYAAAKSVLSWLIPGGWKTTIMTYAGAEIPGVDQIISSSDDSSTDDSSTDTPATDDSSEDTSTTDDTDITDDSSEDTPAADDSLEDITTTEDTDVTDDDTKSTGTIE